MAAALGSARNWGLVCCAVLLALMLGPASVFAVNDISIHVNYPDDVVYTNTVNYVSIWVQNEQKIVGMSLSFAFSSTAGSLSFRDDWCPGFPCYGLNNEFLMEPQYAGTSAFNIGLMVNTSQLPNRLNIGGAAIPPVGLRVNLTPDRFGTLFLDGSNLTDTTGTFCVDNVFIPPSSTWTFDFGNGGFAPTFNGNPNTSEVNPDAPPICFPVKSLLKGDADNNGFVSISDVVYLIYYIFASGPAPAKFRAADADCNRMISISDAIYLRNYVFGGPAPC